MIVLMTDFGLHGPYVGQMHAALRGMQPSLPIVDLCHDLPACDPRSASYLLTAWSQSLPARCVIIAVVDPGVGSAREGLIVRTRQHDWVGPDNGLLSHIIADAPDAQCWRITWLPEQARSMTFHGRDWFAPVAGQLATGISPDKLGCSCPCPQPIWPRDAWSIVHVDHYGNAVSGVRASQVDSTSRLAVSGHIVTHAPTFSAVPSGQVFWYGNSSGLVEIAVNNDRADALGIQLGTGVQLKR